MSSPALQLSVSNFITEQSAIDAAQTPVNINDTAANVAKYFNALNTDANISNITITDGPTPILTLTAYQSITDTDALAKITNGDFHISLLDTPDNITSNVDSLARNKEITSVTLLDAAQPYVHISIAQAVADHALLAEITNNYYSVAVVDTPLNIQKMTPTEFAAISAAGTDDMVSTGNVLLSRSQSMELLFSGIKLDTANGTVTEFGLDGSTVINFFGPAMAAEPVIDPTSPDTSPPPIIPESLFLGFPTTLSGQLYKSITLNTNGTYDVWHFESGTTAGLKFTTKDVAVDANGSVSLVSFYDDVGDLLLKKTIGHDGSITFSYITNDVDVYDVTIAPDQTRQVAINMNGIGPTDVYRKIVNKAGDIIVSDHAEKNGHGFMRLLGSNMDISANSDTILDKADAHTFSFQGTSMECYKFEQTATNDTIHFASGFGSATVNGYSVDGSNIVDVSRLFGTFADAMNSATSSGDGLTLVDNVGDKLTLVGIDQSVITAGKLGFG